MRTRCVAGCCPHDSGLPGSAGVQSCPPDLPDAPVLERVAHLYACQLLSTYRIAGLSADEVGRMLGVSRRVVLRSAHAAGLPVRIGGPPPRRGPSEIELIQALYADTMVRKALTRHGVPLVPRYGPIWQRFPAPHALTAELAAELYSGCGLGLHHIELLTGQPAATVGSLLRASGIPLRPVGGRSPFMRRWRESSQERKPKPGFRVIRCG